MTAGDGGQEDAGERTTAPRGARSQHTPACFKLTALRKGRVWGRDRAISTQMVTYGTWVMRGPGELTHNCPKAGFLNPSPDMETDHRHPRVRLRGKRTHRRRGRQRLGRGSFQCTRSSQRQTSSPPSTAPAAFCTDLLQFFYLVFYLLGIGRPRILWAHFPNACKGQNWAGQSWEPGSRSPLCGAEASQEQSWGTPRPLDMRCNHLNCFLPAPSPTPYSCGNDTRVPSAGPA